MDQIAGVRLGKGMGDLIEDLAGQLDGQGTIAKNEVAEIDTFDIRRDEIKALSGVGKRGRNRGRICLRTPASITPRMTG